MIERREGLTDRVHLAEIMVKNTSFDITREFALNLINSYMERCIEIYKDDVLSGYVVIMNIMGSRSLHGFKLVDGYAFSAFRIAKDMLKEYDDLAITTTADKVNVRRLGKLLGFKETMHTASIVLMERI